MAPRAGFEVEHKFLSAHLVTSVGQLNTPRPHPTSFEPGIRGTGARRCVCSLIDGHGTALGVGSVPGFGDWLVG